MRIRQIDANKTQYKTNKVGALVNKTKGSGMFYFNTSQYTENIQYFFEDSDSNNVFFGTDLHGNYQDYLTIILDMRKNQDKLYFKINDTWLTNVICDIPHTEKQILFDIGYSAQITFMSIKSPSHLPIDFSRKHFSYYKSLNGTIKIC
jgi:hypothetical protein